MKNKKWNHKMKYDLISIANYALKCTNVIDDSNYYDIMKSIERKSQRLRSPKWVIVQGVGGVMLPLY